MPSYLKQFPEVPPELTDRMSPWGSVSVRGRVIVYTALGPRLTDEGVEAFIELQDWVFDQELRVGQVFDFRKLPMLSARQRQYAGRYHADKQHRFKRWVIADSNVLSSALLRGLVKAMHWFASPEYPSEIFGDRGRAIEWVRDRVKAELGDSHGIAV